MPSNIKFGYSFSIIFLIILIYFFYINNYFLLLISISLSFIFLLFSFIAPKILRYPNLLWYKFGILLGKIINPLIMGFIFFLIFTPISIFFKIIGRDELNIKNVKMKTYWKKRETKELEAKSFNNQF